MQIRNTKIFKQFLSVGIIISLVVMLVSRCATISMPLGGPYDTLPPRVVSIVPGYGALNFDDKRITITFDEYVVLKNQQSEFYTSPAMEKTPTLTIRGRSVVVDLTSPLDSNTTYALNFGNTIADNNEGNTYTGFRYVFSTGDYIDSMFMSGYAVNAYTGDTLNNVYVNFFDDATADSLMRLRPWDTIAPDTVITMATEVAAIDSSAVEQLIDSMSREQLVELDSILYKVKANAIARSFSNGIFIAENLAPKDYRIYAFQDNNGNSKYDAGTDLVAFSDSIYNPMEMPPFDIWYDTIQRRLQADPQIYLRLFQEMVVVERSTSLGTFTRPDRQRLLATFTGSNPQIESIVFDSIPADSIITEYLTPGRDTVAFWLGMLPENLPDSIAGRMIYQKHDSLMVLHPDTTHFNLGWVDAGARQREREREQAEKDGEEIPDPVLDVTLQTSSSGKHNLEDKIALPFSLPLTRFDTASMELVLLPMREGDPEQVVSMSFEKDTVNTRRWWLLRDWKPDEQYRLTIPQGALRDISGLANDTLVTEFTIDSPEKYATLLLNINNADPDKEYIVQVLSGTRVVKERTHVVGGQLRIEYISPGEVGIRVLEDSNKNGIWDTGDLRLGRQPEIIARYRDANGSQTITTKLNWELEFDLDMNTLFAPKSMDDIVDDIRRMELEAQRKRDEQRRSQQNR